MVNKDAIGEGGNLANTNKKEGGAGFDMSNLKASKTKVKDLSHESAKNDTKNTMVVNSGNKGGASTHSTAVTD